MTERRERDWLPEGSGNPPRRGVLEDTLFRRLEEMRKKPPGELFELLERTLDVLRATKEALLEQRREIRSLATAVDTLRSRVDQFAQHRPEPVAAEPAPAFSEPLPEPEVAGYEAMVEPAAEPAAEPEAEPEPAALEPAPEPEPDAEPEPEPDLLPAAGWEPERYVHEEAAVEPEVDGDNAAENSAAENSAVEDTAVEDTAVEDTAVESPAEPAFAVAAVDQTSTDETVEHVLMLATVAGYRIVIGDGAQPTPTLEVDGVVFQVSGRMSSPFPGDTRTAFFATRSDSAVAPAA
jgi:hypothetical protein